jgi:hypothetical protein
MHSVKRSIGGFAVINAEGKAIKIFKGRGAKSKAHKHAADLNGQPLTDDTKDSDELKGRGGRGRGGVGRGQ